MADLAPAKPFLQMKEGEEKCDRRRSYQVAELQSKKAKELEYVLQGRQRGETLFDNVKNAKDIQKDLPALEFCQVDLSAENSEEFNEMDIDEASNSNHFVVYDQQSLGKHSAKRSVSVRLDIDAYNEEEIKRAMGYHNQKQVIKPNPPKRAKPQKIIKNQIYRSPNVNINGQCSPVDSSLRRITSKANLSAKSRQGSDRNRCNSGYKTSVKEKLVGSYVQNSTKKHPYGLNHRRSLEDLGVTGDLKVFSPVSNLKKTGMFISKEFFQNPYGSDSKSKANALENSTIQKSKYSRNERAGPISPKFLTFDKNLSSTMHQTTKTKKKQNEIAQKLLHGGSGFLTKQKSNPSLDSSVREHLSPMMENYKKGPQKPQSRNNYITLSQTSKTFESFYSSQMEYQRKKLSKVNEQAEHKLMQERLQTKIMSNMKHNSSKGRMFNVKSKHLDFKKPHLEVDDLTYNSQLRNQLQKSNTMTFSKKIKRELNISDHLYRDASQRQLSRSQRRTSKSPVVHMASPKPNKSTGKFLWKKLKDELQKCFNDYSIHDPITSDEMATVLLELGYIANKNPKIKINGKVVYLVKEIVRILKIPKQISKQVYGIDDQDVTTLAMTKAFIQFLCSPNKISNSPCRNFSKKGSTGNPEYVPEKTGTDSALQYSQAAVYNNDIPLMPSERIDRENATLNPHQKYKLSKLSISLCDSRRQYLDQLKRSEKIRKMNQSPSFRPNISPRSRIIAKKAGKSKKSRKENLPREEEEMKKCTFQPKISPKAKNLASRYKETVFQRLSQGPKKAQKPSQRSPNPEEQKHLPMAKYHPKASKNVKKPRKDLIVKLSLEKDLSDCSPQPSKTLAETLPQLFIDVHLDDKSMHRLTIYEGDSPSKL